MTAWRTRSGARHAPALQGERFRSDAYTVTDRPTHACEQQETTVTEVVTDNRWQRSARRAQSAWRDSLELPAGQWPGRYNVLLGSRLTAADAAAGRNFLTAHALADADAVIAAADAQGRLLHEPRLRENLLSSLPLRFNLFAELRHDLPLATAVLGQLLPWLDAVTEIGYDWNPRRGDLTYTGTDTTLDVAIAYRHQDGYPGLLGMKIVYQEDLSGTTPDLAAPAPYRRLAELSAQRLGVADPRRAGLTQPPLWQLWLPHLLTESYVQQGDVSHAAFVFVYPRGNDACASAWRVYTRAIATGDRYAVTLDTMVETIAGQTSAAWIDAVRTRYLPDAGSL